MHDTFTLTADDPMALKQQTSTAHVNKTWLRHMTQRTHRNLPVLQPSKDLGPASSVGNAACSLLADGSANFRQSQVVTADTGPSEITDLITTDQSPQR